jgi:hypothetical protein
LARVVLAHLELELPLIAAAILYLALSHLLAAAAVETL